ncbi:phosphoribosylformylglycinamidine cyclo-ligase [Ignicoccus islandicus DSM 13165]|uniref:phosphoribosylformylglycinamidine cyclo-ligase n=1 Tax=Ignicoccus islandicus DSM 13165 TaxID=940295 RepID=A0A0U3F8T2_9CREN|nr:phosphoribosylformylglycinamidine cyclo-ligase [Ignicoccus islandicus]ALU12041.1 phosphoribosylformylglycinamidine cyclo-ligase [Ignicoccus islandicus DSM 13165]
MSKWTYSKAGVDIDKQRKMEENILKLVGSKTKGIGSYTSVFEINGKEVTLHVDGVGTKTILLSMVGREDIAGWDCVFVNANDVACEGFKVLAVVDYLAVEKSDEELARRIGQGLDKALREVGAYLAGGETAIMPDVVRGFDISCTVLGIREAKPSVPEPGDYVVGLASSGPHANGYTLIRRLIREGLLKLEDLMPEVIAPVTNYHNIVLEGMKTGVIKWAAHVTGGAFKKVHERLPTGLGIQYEYFEPPAIFKKIVEAARMDPTEAYRTFNMGIGMVIITKHPDKVLELSKKYAIEARPIGRVIEGPSKIQTPWGEVIIG